MAAEYQILTGKQVDLNHCNTDIKLDQFSKLEFDNDYDNDNQMSC
jgi:hypothetical protein